MLLLIVKLDAYLRLPGLSVGSTLCFLCLHLPKFFKAIINFSCNCFYLGMPEMQVSHICILS